MAMESSKEESAVASKNEKLPKGYRNCTVVLLDGTQCEIDVHRNAKGNEVYEKIAQRLNLWEKDYFGLSYRGPENHRIWLNSEKKVSKQLPDKQWTFWFEVKFYPPEPSQLQEDITRYYLCLQLQNDIISGKLPCSFVTYALLGSYLVQAQMGDHDRLDRRLASSEEDYLSDFRFAPYHSTELLRKVRELHQAHRGVSAEDAESRYLEIAKTLAMYGVDLHAAKDTENVDISLGVCSSGLMVYRDRLRVNRFAWPKILKISFRRAHFYIKIRPGEFELRDTTIGFRMPNYKAAERLWKSCVEHHTFFRLMSPEPAPKKTILGVGSSRFRYNGRTHYQSRLASALIERQQPIFQRSQSVRFSGRNTMDGVSAVDQTKPAHTSESATPLHYHSGREAYGTVSKRPNSSGSDAQLRVYTLHRDKDLVEYTLPSNLSTQPQKEYYIIAPQKSPSVTVEDRQRSPKENGTKQSVLQTEGRSSVPAPVFQQVRPAKSGLVERQNPTGSHVDPFAGEFKRLSSGPNDRAVMEQTEKIIEQGPTNVERVIGVDGTIKTTTSSSGVKTVKRVVQRETVETFLVPSSVAAPDYDFDAKNNVEHRIDVYSDGDIDHDAELTAAILEATRMNPSYTVEKIEVKRRDY